MAFTNLATKLLLNDMQVNSGPLGNGFPYLKFAWEVELTLGEGNGDGGGSKGLNSTGPLVAKSCELPRFSVETQVVNVYNHKTIVQTKMNYEPITMTFYDQTNNVAESLIWEFVKGQFDSPDVTKKPGILPLTVQITMKNLSGDGADKMYTLINAFIVDAQHDTLDYSTSDPVVWTLTLRYEELNIAGVKGLDFKGPQKGDGKAGIKALPKPPPKPSVVPITKPPKADARVEAGPSKWKQAGGEENGPLGAAWGNPNLTKQAARHRNKTQAPPKATAPWPANRSGASEATYDTNGNVTGYSASTGDTTAPVVTKTKDIPPKTPEQVQRQKKLDVANKDFVKQEAGYVQDDQGMNPEYKKAYIAGLAKHPPVTNSVQSRMASRDMAEMEALRTAPRYSSQVRTRNADGSFTDRHVPRSVNNNPSATSTQANKEQQYVKKTTKPTDF